MIMVLLQERKPLVPGKDVSEHIEDLRENSTANDKAASALVGAYDLASRLVKMVPARIASIEVVAKDENTITIDDLNPLLGVEMLRGLIEDEDVTHICLRIEPVKQD